MIASHGRRTSKATLNRTTLRTSRLLDFLSRKELIAQTGHEPRDWPLVVVKELMDNALDACEEAEVAPEIKITANDDGITVADNGPGLPASTIESVLDFSIRVSSREAYVAPDRGAQGNALKTILAMPFVLDSEQGTVVIETGAVRHEITMKVDPIRQEPVINHQQKKKVGQPRRGTSVTVCMSFSACSKPAEDDEFLQNHDDRDSSWTDDEEDDDNQTPGDSACSHTRLKARFLQIASDFCWLNPHLTLTMDWFGEQTITKATDPKWKKWRPSDPTSAHWYGPEHLARLIAGYITHDQDHAEEGRIANLGVPVYVLHDFDKAGFSIVGTMQRGTDRYPCELDNVIDMGVRLEDVKKYNLVSEPHRPKGDRDAVERNLSLNGATDEEIEFILNDRVELNAFASDDFIEWIEDKLAKYGVKKVVPDDDTLEEAYRRAALIAYINGHVEGIEDEAEKHAKNIAIPDDLDEQVRKGLEEDSHLPWDDVIAKMIDQEEAE